MSRRIAAALTTFAVVCASVTVFGVGAATADPPESPTETVTPTAPPSTEPPPSEPPPVEEQPSAPPDTPSVPPDLPPESSEQPPAEPAAPDQRDAAEPVAERPQIEVTGEFDEASYHSDDLVTIVLRIKNVGPERATGLRMNTSFSDPRDLQCNPEQLGDFWRQGGATLEAGATTQLTVSGHVRSPDADAVRLDGHVFGQDGFDVRTFSFSAPMTSTTSHVAGTVFGDGNGNGAFDEGEELAGAELTWRYVHGVFEVKATSNAQGRFDLGEIPAASYATFGTAPGFFLTYQVIHIDADEDNTHQLIRAVPPLNGALHASMEFTKDSYAPGDIAEVRVTLSNSGSIPLTGIVAGCNRAGIGPALTGQGPGWGNLAFGTSGVTVPVGATETFLVTERVPDNAIDFGYVSVGCDFGYPEADIENNPGADDIAEVPGAVAELRGKLLKPIAGPADPVEGLPGVRVVLVREGDCPVIGEATTDANGEFVFTNLKPARDYLLYFLPPAGFHFSNNPDQVWVIANNPGQLILVSQPGDAPLPQVPTNPASCTPPPATTTPVPQASSGSGLAQTGSDMLSLGTMGLLALLLGAAVVFASYRRRAKELNFLEP